MLQKGPHGLEASEMDIEKAAGLAFGNQSGA
jgi:hypothetical protein